MSTKPNTKTIWVPFAQSQIAISPTTKTITIAVVILVWFLLMLWPDIEVRRLWLALCLMTPLGAWTESLYHPCRCWNG